MKKAATMLALLVALVAGAAAGQLALKSRNPADQVETRRVDGWVYVEFPAQIQANGAWQAVTVAVAQPVWVRVCEEMKAAEGSR